MKKIYIDIITKTVSAIILIIVGILISNYKYYVSSEPDYIDIKKEKSIILNSKLEENNEKSNEFNAIRFSLYNFNRKVFENLKILIKIRQNKLSDPILLELNDIVFYDANGVQESIQQFTNSSINQGLEIGYIINNIEIPCSENEPFCTFELLLSNSKMKDYQIYILNSGIKSRNYNQNNFKISGFANPLIWFLVLLLLFVSFLSFSILKVRRKYKEIELEYEDIKEFLLKNDYKKEFEFLNEMKIKNTYSMSKFEKWITGVSKSEK